MKAESEKNLRLVKKDYVNYNETLYVLEYGGKTK
jgi:hypothetical protein